MAQLVGVDDGTDGLDGAIDDVEGEHVGHLPLNVVADRPLVTVDFGRLEANPELADLVAKASEQARDTICSHDRIRPLRHLASTVAVNDDVRGEELDQAG